MAEEFTRQTSQENILNELWWTELEAVTNRLWNDKPTKPVDAVLFGGRSWHDAQKEVLYRLAKDLYKQGMAKYIALYGGEGQRFGTAAPVNVVAPIKALARARFIKMGVPNEDIIDSDLPDVTKNNTLEEGRGFLKLAEKEGWKRLVFVANPHQVLRMMLGLVKDINERGLDTDIYVATPTPDKFNWWRDVRGSQGIEKKPVYEHIQDEVDRIFHYQRQGDLSSFAELNKYLSQRDER